MDEEEIRKREQDRLEKKRKKQEDRLRKLEERRKSLHGFVSGQNTLLDINGQARSPLFNGNFLSPTSSEASSESFSDHVSTFVDISGSRDNGTAFLQTPPRAHENKASLKSCPFSIDRLLEAPKVPRGRRPNSKYPLVQACKSLGSLSLGLLPFFPITQPMGFLVQQLSQRESPISSTTSTEIDMNSFKPERTSEEDCNPGVVLTSPKDEEMSSLLQGGSVFNTPKLCMNEVTDDNKIKECPPHSDEDVERTEKEEPFYCHKDGFQSDEKFQRESLVAVPQGPHKSDSEANNTVVASDAATDVSSLLNSSDNNNNHGNAVSIIDKFVHSCNFDQNHGVMSPPSKFNRRKMSHDSMSTDFDQENQMSTENNNEDCSNGQAKCPSPIR